MPISTLDRAGVKRVAALQLRGMSGPLRARVSWPRSAHSGSGLLVLFGRNERLDQLAAMADRLCAQAQVVVLSAPCRVTVADSTRATLDKARLVLAWASDHAGEIGADPRRLALGGYRRGAAVAAAMALHARDRGWPPIARQLLAQPDFGAALPDRAAQLGTDTSFQAPTLAVSLAGVAPATIITAGEGPLADHGRRYARRLRLAGVAVEAARYAGEDTHADAMLATLASSAREAVGADAEC